MQRGTEGPDWQLNRHASCFRCSYRFERVEGSSGRPWRAPRYVALAEMRAITHAEGKPSSYPNLLARSANTRRPGPARARDWTP
jgi:hypothetical protein